MKAIFTLYGLHRKMFDCKVLRTVFRESLGVRKRHSEQLWDALRGAVWGIALTIDGGDINPQPPIEIHCGPIETHAAVWTTQERPSLRNSIENLETFLRGLRGLRISGFQCLLSHPEDTTCLDCDRIHGG